MNTRETPITLVSPGVIEAWPQLNDAVRDRIAGLVEGAGLLRSSE